MGILSVNIHAAGLKVVAAENFYGGIVSQIAGEGAIVTSILTNPNQDPHEFATNTSTAKAVADADIVIYNGIDYDPWMDKLLGTKGSKRRTTINVSELIGARSGDNPHIWYDPNTILALADKLASVLGDRDAAEVSTYKQRVEEFRNSMKPVLDQIAAIRSAHQGLAITATEPVFGYMAKALGFKMLNYPFQVNVMNDTEPSASQTIAFEKSLTTRSAGILFYNSQVTDPTTERLQKLAKQSGVPIVGVTETQPPGLSYVEWMKSELNSVQTALGLINN